MSAHPYHRMGITAKRSLALEHAREQPLRCPWCEASVMPAELLEHAATRCPGPREPHRGARWLSYAEATALVTKSTLHRLTESGVVRVRGEARRRRWLQRDLVLAVAWRERLSRAPSGGNAADVRRPTPATVGSCFSTDIAGDVVVPLRFA